MTGNSFHPLIWTAYNLGLRLQEHGTANCMPLLFFLNTRAHDALKNATKHLCVSFSILLENSMLNRLRVETLRPYLIVCRQETFFAKKSLPCLIFRRRERLQFCCTTPFASSGTVKGCSWMLGTWHLAEAQHSDMSMPATSIALQTHCGTSPFGNCISWFMQSDTYCIWMKEHNRTDSNFSFWIWQGARQLVIWPIISIIKMQP